MKIAAAVDIAPASAKYRDFWASDTPKLILAASMRSAKVSFFIRFSIVLRFGPGQEQSVIYALDLRQQSDQ